VGVCRQRRTWLEDALSHREENWPKAIRPIAFMGVLNALDDDSASIDGFAHGIE
jgi:hypothetical protein